MMPAIGGVEMIPRRSALLLALSLALALPAAADWKLIRGNDKARLSIDEKSIERKGDETAFRFLIDLREAEGDIRQGPQHRSVVTQARVRCKDRTIAMGDQEAFVQNGGNGIPIGRRTPQGAEAGFRPLEKQSSDEDLWGYVCDAKSAAPPKAAPAKDAPKKK
jgi:hypothetical protein